MSRDKETKRREASFGLISGYFLFLFHLEASNCSVHRKNREGGRERERVGGGTSPIEPRVVGVTVSQACTLPVTANNFFHRISYYINILIFLASKLLEYLKYGNLLLYIT